MLFDFLVGGESGWNFHFWGDLPIWGGSQSAVSVECSFLIVALRA
jgi:hypothetical protein